MPKSFLEVVLLGDSITWSARAPYGQRYADFAEAGLQRRLGAGWVVDVASCGNGGNTAEQGLERVERDAIAYEPHAVVLNFGGNDSGRVPRDSFIQNYTALVDRIRAQTRAAIVLETIPGVDPARHASRTRPEVIAAGGPDARVNAYAHSFIRELAGRAAFALHDRHAAFHERLARDPSAMERLIRPDGIHLTVEGNRVFGETLAEALSGVLPRSDAMPEDGRRAAAWLERARSNPVFREWCDALRNGRPLEGREDGQLSTRLPLQQCWSFARRAGVLAGDPALACEALRVEGLAASLLALMRMKGPYVAPATRPDTLAWALDRLEPLGADPLAEALRCRLKASAEPAP